MSEDHMVGPGAHENVASSAMMDGDYEQAKVAALLVLASAVNRLAAAHEAIANAQN